MVTRYPSCAAARPGRRWAADLPGGPPAPIRARSYECPVHHIFQRFIDRLSSARDTETLHASMAEAAAALDLSCFAYLSVPLGACCTSATDIDLPVRLDSALSAKPLRAF